MPKKTGGNGQPQPPEPLNVADTIAALKEQVGQMQTVIGQLTTIVQKNDERTIEISSAVVEKSMKALTESLIKQRAEAEAKRQEQVQQYEKEVAQAEKQPQTTTTNGSLINQLIQALPQFVDAWQKVKGPPTPEQQVFRELEMGFKIHRALDSMKTGDISAFESIFTKKP